MGVSCENKEILVWVGFRDFFLGLSWILLSDNFKYMLMSKFVRYEEIRECING